MKELKPADCATVLVVVITPRKSDGSIDLDGIRTNLSYLDSRGITFVMPMCGTGLVYDATLDEYEVVIGEFIKAATGNIQIVPGIGPGYGRSIEMGFIARSLGVPGVMIMPVVGPASAKGVELGITHIVERIKLPVILYQRRLDIMPVDQIVRLCGRDGVIGLKYAVDDIKSFQMIVDRVGHSAAMVCGMAEDPALDYLDVGAVGFSSGMANFVPKMSLALLKMYKDGNLNGAREIRDVMVPFEDFRGERSARYSGSALHAAMDYVGLSAGPVTPFAEDVTMEDLPRMKDMIDKILKFEQDFCKEKN